MPWNMKMAIQSLHYDTVQWNETSSCLIMSGISNNESVFKFSDSYIFTFLPIFFFQFYTMWSKKSSVCNIKCLFWACSFLMRTLSVLIEAQTRLSIKIHRRNFHVSTDPQWVQIIFGLEYQIFIRCFLDLLKSGMYFLN